ncbi:MAG: hypothetical protein ACRC3Y_02320 [Romboutsia sp.]|uniref:hypothetical protein n=1 Tax=Romboutsia sp. TaxID=1965302 RepID=UPI003F2F916D
MKKLITIIILCSSFICISGCNLYNQKIIWNLEYIQNKSGEIIYCSMENKDIYPDATIKNIICVLQESNLTITDKDTDTEWSGNYKQIESIGNHTSIYEIIFDSETGKLVKSFTKYVDGTSHDTLIISCGEYSLTFRLT